MSEDKALEQIARFTLDNAISLQELFAILIGNNPNQVLPSQFIKDLIKLGIDEAAATALSLRPDLFCDSYLNVKVLERKLTQTYLVRLQKKKFIKQAFLNLTKMGSKESMEAFVKEIFQQGCSRDEFIQRVCLKGVKIETAINMVSAFDEIDNQLLQDNFNKVVFDLCQIHPLTTIKPIYIKLGSSLLSPQNQRLIPASTRNQVVDFMQFQLLNGLKTDTRNNFTKTIASSTLQSSKAIKSSVELKQDPDIPSLQVSWMTARPFTQQGPKAQRRRKSNVLHVDQVNKQTFSAQDLHVNNSNGPISVKSFRLNQRVENQIQNWTKHIAVKDFILYEKPSMNSSALAQIYKGTQILIDEGQNTHWMCVSFRQVEGWVLKSNMRLKSLSPPPRTKAQDAPLKKQTYNGLVSEIQSKSPERIYQDLQNYDEPEKQLKMVKSVAIDASKSSLKCTSFGGLGLFELHQQRDQVNEKKNNYNLLFRKYDQQSLTALYSFDKNKKLKNKICPPHALEMIKSRVEKQILRIRNQADSPDEETIQANNKKRKFLRFILNIQIKAGFRMWKEQTFGVQGDPRLAVIILEERDRVRQRFYEPVIEQRKQKRYQILNLKERNKKIVQTMRVSLDQYKTWDQTCKF